MSEKTHDDLLARLEEINPISGFSEAFAAEAQLSLAQLLDQAPDKYHARLEKWRTEGATAKKVDSLDKAVRKTLKQRQVQQRTALKQGQRSREIPEDQFILDEQGRIARRAHNIRLGLSKLEFDIRHNEFSDMLFINGQSNDDKLMDDAWLSLDDSFDFEPTRDKFAAVVGQVGRQHRFHPVRDYLNKLKWDGQPRLGKWVHTYLGADDTELNEVCGRLILKAGVARVFDPGCKFDEMMLLTGPQGLSKSSAIQALAPDPSWFTDSMPLNASEQKVIEATRGKWLVEISDLKGNSKAEVDDVKAQLSQQVDRARMAYARLPIDVPRQFVFWGTTNADTPLSDYTGNRRFWPIMCRPVTPEGLVDLEGIRRDRDQLWAEAVFEYWLDPDIMLPSRLYPAARAVQAAHTKENPLQGKLEYHMGDLEGSVPAEVLWEVLSLRSTERERMTGNFGLALRNMGWERTKKRVPGKGPVWCYVKGDAARWIGLTNDQSGRTTLGHVVYRNGEAVDDEGELA